jgi:hypothetical protein
MHTKFYSRKLKEKGHLRDLGVAGRKIFKNIAYQRNRARECELDSAGSEYNSVTGSCEHVNELTGSIKGEELLDQLRQFFEYSTTLQQ